MQLPGGAGAAALRPGLTGPGLRLPGAPLQTALPLIGSKAQPSTTSLLRPRNPHFHTTVKSVCKQYKQGNKRLGG